MESVEKVVVIIPTYNEAGCISETIESLQSEFNRISDYQMHILVFDSNSTDDTTAIVKNYQSLNQNIHFQSEPQKSGLGSAYSQAMQYAIDSLDADIVFEFDADGSHQPKYIPQMMHCFSQGADVVVGSRYMPGGSASDDWSPVRKYLSKLGNYVSRALLIPKYKDFTSGFRGTRTEWLKQVELDNLLSASFGYKMHLFWELHHLGANIIEYPIEFLDRKGGHSKFSKSDMKDCFRVILALRIRSMKRLFSGKKISQQKS